MTAPRLTLNDALDVLPKVELHCHVGGTMRPETLAELAGVAADEDRRPAAVAEAVDRLGEPSDLVVPSQERRIWHRTSPLA